MPQFKRSVAVLVLLVLCVGCDQVTKDAAQQYVAFEPPHSWFHDTVRLEYAENTGAFQSLGGGLSEEFRILFFQVLPALWLIVLTIYLLSAKPASMLPTVAWSLILSGGLGNLLDRIMNEGRVIDFMNIGIGSLSTGIFNVADVGITTGVVLLSFWIVWPHQSSLRSEPPR
jgi:signal peptidase II